MFYGGTHRIGPGLFHVSCRAGVKLLAIPLLPQSAPRCGPRAPPNNEIGFDDDFFGVGPLYRGVEAAQNGLSGKDTHPAERLLDGRNTRVLKRGALNFVEAHYGNVLRYASACFTQGLNGANRRHVIERKQGREWLARSTDHRIRIVRPGAPYPD